MISFILNNETIAADVAPGTILLDFIRYHKNLTGTKIGCREGDCGACTIMVGTLNQDTVHYSTVTSCLMPMGNAHGKHIVTIEGINQQNELTPVQQAFAEEGATQCGFCTPGFIMSLTNHCLQQNSASHTKAIDAMNGNICRCTGYKSIERAAENLCKGIAKTGSVLNGIEHAIENKIVQQYFSTIPQRLKEIRARQVESHLDSKKILGGGTDLYVQQHDTMPGESIRFLLDDARLRRVEQVDQVCHIGGAATVTDIAGSSIFKNAFGDVDQFIKLISSTQIRNMATVAGNIANASPIGDLSIFFLALNAELTLEKDGAERMVSLRRFYKGYKQMDMQQGEIITKLSFRLPTAGQHFNFEKVCKRSWLDIASVNSAILVEIKDDVITSAAIAAGGVAPVPLFLEKSSDYLVGKTLNDEILQQLLEQLQKEISPISDVRGSEKYKRLLLTQLVKAHFIKLFPGKNFSF